MGENELDRREIVFEGRVIYFDVVKKGRLPHVLADPGETELCDYGSNVEPCPARKDEIPYALRVLDTKPPVDGKGRSPFLEYLDEVMPRS